VGDGGGRLVSGHGGLRGGLLCRLRRSVRRGRGVLLGADGLLGGGGLLCGHQLERGALLGAGRLHLQGHGDEGGEDQGADNGAAGEHEGLGGAGVHGSRSWWARRERAQRGGGGLCSAPPLVLGAELYDGSGNDVVVLGANSARVGCRSSQR
jgi:hypothetical protein